MGIFLKPLNFSVWFKSYIILCAWQ